MSLDENCVAARALLALGAGGLDARIRAERDPIEAETLKTALAIERHTLKRSGVVCLLERELRRQERHA